jgi:Tfp pilus assembly protein PilN
MSTINLLPEDYLRSRARKRANILCLVLFAVVMAGVLTAAVVTDRNSRNTRNVCDQVNASYAEAAKLIEQVNRLRDHKTTLLAKAEQASALQERVPRSYILGTLTNALPERASVLSVRLETRAADPERMSKFGAVAAQRGGKAPLFVDLVVTGQAATDMDVARLIANLARNPLLANVDLVYSEERTVDKNAIREFQVKMEVKPGIDVLDVIGPPAPAHAAAAPKAPAQKGGPI